MRNWSLRQKFDSTQGTIRWDSQGEGPPVVLLHGTPSWSFLWRRVAPRLADHHQVFYFDWPGYGTSTQSEDQNLSWDEQPRRLAELFNFWGLERPAVVAHDIAPLLLLRAHLLEALPVGPMVLANAAVVPPFVTGFSGYARDHIGVFRGIPTHISEAMIARHLQTTVCTPMEAEVLEQYMRPWRGSEGVAAYWRAVAAYDENLAQPVRERLHQVRSRTLILWGIDDEWEPAWKADELASLIPDATPQFLDQAGHFSPEDRPEDFADAVLRFLETT